MKLLLKFSGFNDYDEKLVVEWDQKLLDFPEFVKYDSRFWGWVMHDQDFSGIADSVLLFSEHQMLPCNKLGSIVPFSVIEEMFKLESKIKEECECGQKNDLNAKHSDYCPRYVKA
jgi:hypothetical protein